MLTTMISSEYFRLPRHSGGTKISDILTILSFPISLALYSIFSFTTAFKNIFRFNKTATKITNSFKAIQSSVSKTKYGYFSYLAWIDYFTKLFGRLSSRSTAWSHINQAQSLKSYQLTFSWNINKSAQNYKVNSLFMNHASETSSVLASFQ